MAIELSQKTLLQTQEDTDVRRILQDESNTSHNVVFLVDIPAGYKKLNLIITPRGSEGYNEINHYNWNLGKQQANALAEKMKEMGITIRDPSQDITEVKACEAVIHDKPLAPGEARILPNMGIILVNASSELLRKIAELKDIKSIMCDPDSIDKDALPPAQSKGGRGA